MEKHKTLQEICEHLRGGQVQYRWPIRLFNDVDNKLLENSDTILASKYLGRFEVTRISFNEMSMTYDLRIRAMPEIPEDDYEDSSR